MPVTRPAFPIGVAIALLCVPWPVPCRAQESPAAPDSARIFHRGLPYGSDALFNPVTLVFNRGYEIVQLTSSDRDIWSFPYRVGFTRFLPDLIRHPGAAIERHPGWSEWLRTEVLPLSYGDARWVVNWSEHFLGGGLQYRVLADWYAARGVPRPKVLAGVTVMATAALNEVMEHPGIEEGTSSSVADLWLFDLGGVLFFTWERPARWAVEHLQLADWSNMATLMVPGGELENNGQYFVVKLPLPRVDERLFVRFGLGIQFGVTRALDEEHALSIGLGLDTRGRIVDPVTHQEDITFMYTSGVYLDRNNSLLASLTFRDQAPHQVVLNLYPGLGGGLLADLGLWVKVYEGDLRVGIVHRWPGFGLGVGY